MATTITKSIGTTGRDYSTLQAWEDAIPADLVAADEVWVGECYNDSEFTAGVTIASHTCDATRYIKLTAATGQSFQDNASVRSNPLVYDQSKGVGIHTTAVVAITISVTDYVRVERLQVLRTASGYATGAMGSSSSASTLIKDCIVGQDGSLGVASYVINGFTSYINVLVYDKTTSGSARGIFLAATVSVLNCTVVNGRGSVAGNGLELSYATATINNTAVFGWTNAINGTTVSAGDYNATDAASWPTGTHNQLSKTYADQFESTTADWRLKAGSDCIAHGNTDATLAPKDISNFTRAATTGGSISAWEYSAAGGTLLKAQGIAVASVSKLNQIAYASIKSANGLTTGN